MFHPRQIAVCEAQPEAAFRVGRQSAGRRYLRCLKFLHDLRVANANELPMLVVQDDFSPNVVIDIFGDSDDPPDLILPGVTDVLEQSCHLRPGMDFSTSNHSMFIPMKRL